MFRLNGLTCIRGDGSQSCYISVNNGNRETFGFEEQNEILWLSMAKLVLYCIRYIWPFEVIIHPLVKSRLVKQ